MLKVLITDMQGNLLESAVVTAEQVHLDRKDWTGAELEMARAVLSDLTEVWNVEED